MRKVIFPLLVLGVAALIYFTGQDKTGSDVADFEEEISTFRQEREDYLRTSAASPMKNMPNGYSKVEYFPPDPTYRVNARVEKITELAYVTIQESKGKQVKYVKYANLHFKLDGKELDLLVLKPLGFGPLNTLFTAFADETSGSETYGAGRYLDLSFKNATSIVLDFNKAYNPYCAYNTDFSCPFPPAENILPVAIRAGEKNYPE